MITIDARRRLAFTSLVLLGGCTESNPIAWGSDRALDLVQLDAQSPNSDYEFRICKDGVPTQEEATAELRLTARVSEGAEAEQTEVIVRQWATKEEFEASASPTLITRGFIGDPLQGNLQASAPFTEPGELCGPWSVFRIELDQPAEDTVISISGAFVVEFADDSGPLEEFRVEMPDW